MINFRLFINLWDKSKSNKSMNFETLAYTIFT